jgi:cbb3-type cytochrome oxidase maturation protein
MSVIIILIIASIFVALLFLIGFIWAVKSGQYDDTYSPSVRVLFDNKEKSGNSTAAKNNDITTKNHPKNQQKP